LLRLLLPLFCILLATSVQAAEGPLPGTLPSAFLPAAGSAWLAQTQWRSSGETRIGLQLVTPLSVTLRQPADRGDAVGDIDLRLWSQGRHQPALILGVRGLGNSGERLDSALVGVEAAGVQLSTGVGWRGGIAENLRHPIGLFSLRLPLPLIDDAWITASAGTRGHPYQPRLTATLRPLPRWELSGGWQRRRGLLLGLAARWDLADLDEPWPLPARQPDRQPITEITATMPAANSIAAAALAADSPSTVTSHRLGLPGIAVQMTPGSLEHARHWRGSGAEIRRAARFSRAPYPASIARHWELTMDASLEAGPGPDGSGWAQRSSAGAALTLVPLAGLILHGGGRLTVPDAASRPALADDTRGRGELALYMAEGITMERAQGAIVAALSPALDMMLEAGHLDEMYSGAGGELRWQPPLDRWSIGLTAHHLWQRLPGGIALLRGSDKTVGHLTLGWEGPDAETRLELAAGRYLAGDWGGTAGLSRRFGTGALIATDLTVDRDGGTTLGLSLTVPLGDLWNHAELVTRAKIRPLARSQRERLDRAFTLGDLRHAAGYGRMLRDWDRAFTRPVE
jgi:hypothetical protein